MYLERQVLCECLRYFKEILWLLNLVLFCFVFKISQAFTQCFNILRITVSFVLKILLNVTVGIGHAVVIFHSYKPTGSTSSLY